MVELFEGHPEFPRTEKVRIDMLKRFGLYSTESNGHLSEYVAWYRKRPGEIEKWIDTSCWINGETGGYLRVCTEGRNWFETDFHELDEGRAQPPPQAPRRGAQPAYILEGLETGRVYRGHFNVVNRSCITNLAPDAIVEGAPGYIDRNGMNIPAVEGELAWGAAAVCAPIPVNVQRLAVARPRRPAMHTLLRPGPAAGSAHRGGVQSARGVADVRRDAGGPGAVASCSTPRPRPRPRSASPQPRRTAAGSLTKEGITRARCA